MQPIIFKNRGFELAFYNSCEVTILFLQWFVVNFMKLTWKRQLRSPQIVPEFVTHIVEVFHGFSIANSFHVFRTEEGDAYS